MKKILSLLVLLTVFCAVSFAQSAPKAAKKATLMPANIEVKNLKTGQVIGVTKGTSKTPTTSNVKKMKMTRSGANTPTNSKQSSGKIPVKQLPKNIKTIKKLEQQ